MYKDNLQYKKQIILGIKNILILLNSVLMCDVLVHYYENGSCLIRLKLPKLSNIIPTQKL